MKKCPFCAEEIQEAAIICKHCKSKLPVEQTTAAVNTAKSSFDGRKLLKYFIYIVLGIIALGFWYFTVPAFLIWLVNKKQTDKKMKYILFGLIILAFVIIDSAFFYSTRAPVIEISAPQEGYVTSSTTVEIKGKVDPVNSAVNINMRSVAVDSNGMFTHDIKFNPDNDNLKITIKAKNGSSESSKIINVGHTPSESEIKDREKKMEEQRKIEEEKIAKEKAVIAAYENSRAGKLCKKYPSWSKEDCQSIADNKYWIGMTYEMLVEVRGKPEHINPSNYGGKTHYQYCWMDHSPRCFYDNNDDDIIDAYN